jgi:kinesin family protein 3/17
LIKEKFSSLAEELEFKTNKLEKLWGKYQEASEQLQSIGDDFDRERNDMYDTIFELTNQLKLKNMIIEYMIPPEEYRKYEKIAEWNDETNDWVINNPTQFKDLKTGSKRP